ncbi:TetR/AcrR family transcriptional regulator [Burkholderia sp. Ac-20384]|uniref:TetR/AcrR family transcriptional regulator n=1 Tax=Burkholderia sp. Ac-20384 TaxID=2703902 RepID=UPI00197EA2B6|nr:TetR/AcrR family transcriptional regulator [Burkholderia sp. Ac-20384]MBN3827506.1 TetR/AcrR family transcriptional regulator [Burkholderia sp. Ac-20384]
MGHSQADKARSRERILELAAEQIREQGLESISVSKLMNSANLTHGGFYGHFDSRSDLLLQALQRALNDGSLTVDSKNGKNPPEYGTIVRSYLSRKHREARGSGCAIAALAGDVARADEPTREAMSKHIEQFVEKLGASMEGRDESQALFTVSALIGALVVSRVIVDKNRSDAVLAAAKRALLALSGER